MCTLAFSCLDFDEHLDSDGQRRASPVLVHDMPKVGKTGCRLPIHDREAAIIRAQQARVRAAFPDTPPDRLALFPRPLKNPDGTKPLSTAHLQRAMRDWAARCPALTGPTATPTADPCRSTETDCSPTHFVIPTLSPLPLLSEGRAFGGKPTCLTSIRTSVGTPSYVRPVTDSMSSVFQAERAVSPVDGSELWVVLDAELLLHREASDFLRCLQGATRSPHTIRAYAGRVALFLGWCQAQGVDWRRIGLPDLARFKRWLEICPGRGGRIRSGSTVNAMLTAVCEFLRFCARTGLIEPIVAERLSEPRWLRFTPPGFDTGESGQFRTVRARALKARAKRPSRRRLPPSRRRRCWPAAAGPGSASW